MTDLTRIDFWIPCPFPRVRIDLAMCCGFAESGGGFHHRATSDYVLLLAVSACRRNSRYPKWKFLLQRRASWNDRLHCNGRWPWASSQSCSNNVSIVCSSQSSGSEHTHFYFYGLWMRPPWVGVSGQGHELNDSIFDKPLLYVTKLLLVVPEFYDHLQT